MIHSQNTKLVKIYDPVSIAAATAATTIIDTNGFDYCTIFFYAGVVHSGGMTTLDVKEGEASNGSDAAAFSNENGVVGFGASGQKNIDGSTAAAVGSTNSVLYEFQIDCLARKRYLKTGIVSAGTSVIAAFAVLSRAEDLGSPDVLANIGATGCIRA